MMMMMMALEPDNNNYDGSKDDGTQ